MGSTSDNFFLISLISEMKALWHVNILEPSRHLYVLHFHFSLLLPSDENDSEIVGPQTLASDEKGSSRSKKNLIMQIKRPTQVKFTHDSGILINRWMSWFFFLL
jgi:hypothetical protein